MPIQQINDDGTVKIVNSQSGQVLDVKPEQLGNYSPKLVAEYQTKLPDYQAKQAAINLYKQGQIPLTQDQAIKDPALAQKAIAQGVKISAKADPKKEDSLSATVNLLNTLEKHYQGAGGGSFGGGPIGGLKGFAREMEGKIGMNDEATTYGDEKAGFAATLKSLTGDTGVLTDQDFARLSQLLPSLGAPSGVAKNKFNDLRMQLAAKYGGKPTDTTYLAPGEMQKKNEVVAPQNGITHMGNQPGLQFENPQKQIMQESMGPNIPQTQGGASQTQQAATFLRSIGLGAFPDAGAVLSSIPSGGKVDGNNPFITADEMQKVKQEGQLNTAKNAAGVASYMPNPITASLKAAPLLKFLATNGIAGALGAASQEGFDPQKMTQGALGANAVAGALKIPSGVTSAVGRSAPNFINQLFKPTGSATNEFRRNTGGMDFANEVIKRDLPAIKGKTAPEILDYYNSKLGGLNDAADKFLKDHGGSVNKADLMNIINEHAAQLTPANGQVLQGAGKNALENLAEEVHLMPDNISLHGLNQIKRNIQTAAQSAFGPSGTSSPTSNALATVQKKIGNLIEQHAPGIKDINKTIQFNHLAKDSIQNRVDQASRSEGGLITQGANLLGASGALTGAMTGNPALMLGAVAPALANALYRNSRFKTMAADAARKMPQAQDNEILRRILAPAGGRESASF